MAADVDIREFNGVSPGTPTVKNGSTVQFKNIDNAIVEVPLVNPVVRPTVPGSVYSYEKALRLHIDSPGPVNNITSPRAYGDGVNSMPTGVNLTVGATGTYSQPVNTASAITGITLWSTKTALNPQALDLINTGPFSGTNVDIGDFLYLQVALLNFAGDPPTTGTEPVTLAYDET